MLNRAPDRCQDRNVWYIFSSILLSDVVLDIQQVQRITVFILCTSPSTNFVRVCFLNGVVWILEGAPGSPIAHPTELVCILNMQFVSLTQQPRAALPAFFPSPSFRAGKFGAESQVSIQPPQETQVN
jgi:hypothetical protein